MYHPIFILYFALSLPPCSYNFAFLEQNSCKLDLSCFYNLLLKNPVCTQLFFSVIIYLLSQGTLTKVFVFLPVTAIYRTVFPAFLPRSCVQHMCIILWSKTSSNLQWLYGGWWPHDEQFCTKHILSLSFIWDCCW